jgi:hypothetical protein
MKTFKLQADATFQAENIDDAFEKLSDHFRDLYLHGVDGESIVESGSISVNLAEAEELIKKEG